MTRPQPTLFTRPALMPAIFVCALFAAACGGAGTTDASGGGKDVTATYSAAFASGSRSGTFSLTTHSTGHADGTLLTVAGVSSALSGSYTPTTGAFTASGGGFSFTGTTSASAASGSFTGPDGSGGSFSGLPQANGVTPSSYCGSWQESTSFGWVNVIVSGPTMTGVAGGPYSDNVSLSGTVTGTNFTGTILGSSEGTTVSGTIVAGDSLAGTIASLAGNGSFGASKAACATAGTASTLSGAWATAQGPGTTITVALLQVSAALSGAGVITVQPGIAAISGGGPPWTGDGYTLTAGSVTGTSVTFTSTLVGNNPRGAGGFYHGQLTFTGTVTNGATMTGTLTYTPTFTDSQVFAQQTATVTLTRQ